MGQQVAQHDRPLRGTQLGRASGVKPLQDPGRAQYRVDIGQRLFERELALLDKLHGRDAGHRLGHRGDAEDGVERHRRAVAKDARAERAFVEQALVGRYHRHHAGHVLGLNRLAEHAVDASPGERGTLLRCGAVPSRCSGNADRGGSSEGHRPLQQVAAAE
jgi:hypothetical protein